MSSGPINESDQWAWTTAQSIAYAHYPLHCTLFPVLFLPPEAAALMDTRSRSFLFLGDPEGAGRKNLQDGREELEPQQHAGASRPRSEASRGNRGGGILYPRFHEGRALQPGPLVLRWSLLERRSGGQRGLLL